MLSEQRKNLNPTLEVIIPVYDEEQSIDPLLEELNRVFSSENLKQHSIAKIHYRFIDDGSSDQTPQQLASAIQQGLPATLHILSRNFGHQAAISAGLQQSQADLVGVMDADLQDPPELFFKMVSQWREGSDVVYGKRVKRKGFFLYKIAYFCFYRLLNFISDIDIPMDTGDFGLMDRRVVAALNALPENLRFPRGLRAWVGFQQTPVPYERPARHSGTAKYTLSKLYHLATDGIASVSLRPLQITQFFAFSLGLLTGILAIYSVYRIWINPNLNSPLAPWFLTSYCLTLVCSFMVSSGMYIMSAYLGRTYMESKRRPGFVIRETLGSENEH